MRIQKVYAIAFILTLFKIICALINVFYYELEFGKSLIGWDEIQWQDSSIFFFENGLGYDSVKMSFALPGGFNNGGFPYLIGIIHSLFGLSYINVLFIRFILYFFSIICLYDLLINSGHGFKVAIASILFLTLYNPFLVADATYLRDDILVFIIIILLKLTTFKGFIKGFIGFVLFSILSYILILSRPFAFLVFLSLYFFYFKLNDFKHYILFAPILFLIPYLPLNIYSHALAFLGKFNFDIQSVLFLTLKFYFGPIPYQMIGVDTGYNPIWYLITLVLILWAFKYKLFYRSLFKNWKVVIALFISGLFPYIISNQEVDAVGPRQFAMIGPFLFFILYGEIIKKISFNHKIFDKQYCKKTYSIHERSYKKFI
jgi:hypothetical protein